MRRFILFFSVIFLSFYTSNAQTITITETDSILCNGQLSTIEGTTTSIPAGSNWICIQQTSIGWSTVAAPQQANSNTVSYPNLNTGQYAILLVSNSYNASTDDTTNANTVFAVADYFVFPAPPFVASASLLDSNDCFGDCEGVILVQVFGGVGALLHDNGQGGNINNTVTGSSFQITNLCSNSGPPNYTVLPPTVVNLVDENNCITSTSPVAVYEPAPMQIDSVIVDSITCYDANDGQIQVNHSGGQTPYTYTWIDTSGVVWDTATTITNPTGTVLNPGTWVCIVTDANGCDTMTDAVELNNPPELEIEVTVLKNPTCDGSTDGEILVDTINGNGGSGFDPNLGGYQLTIDGVQNYVLFPFGAQSPNFSLAAGSIVVTVADRNGCVEDTTVILTDPDPITFDTSTTAILCTGDCNGEVVLSNFQGGNYPTYGSSSVYYTYIDPQGDTLTHIIPNDSVIIDSNLCAGVYTYIIKDSLDCESDPVSVTLVDPPLFEIVASNPFFYQNGFNVSCPGVNDASFNVQPFNAAQASGGLVEYYVNGPLNTISAASIITVDSIYGDVTNGDSTEIVAIDANGCIDTTRISLLEPNPYIVSLTAVDENCSQNNGKIYATVIGGVPNYQYDWSGPNGYTASAGPMPNTSDSITNLFAGTYNITITDDLGCIATNSIIVDSTSILITTEAFPKCNDSTAAIILNSNGVLLNTLLWSSSTALGGSAGDTLKWVDPLTATFDTISGLSEGTYWYQVQRNGCNPYTGSVTIGPDLTVSASLDALQSVTQLNCFGDFTNDIWINVIDNFQAAGVSNSTPNSYNYTILQTGLTALGQNPPHNVLTASGGLPAGSYDVIVVPEPNTFPNLSTCIDTVSVTISQPDSVEFSLGYIENTCYGDSTGSVFVSTILGGNTGTYNYTWTNSLGDTIGNTNTINSLPAGWYYLSVTDTLNCQPASIDSIEITQPTEVIMNVTVTAIDSCSATGGSTGSNSIGEFHINSQGGTPYLNSTYDFNWWPSGIFTNNNMVITSPLDSVGTLPSGTYVVEISDSLGCSQTDSVVINEGINPKLDSTSFTNISCNGLSDGSYIAIIDSVNGSQSFPYTFWNFDSTAWIPGFIPSSGSVYSAGDTITIRVKDNFGCVDDISHIFTEPDELIIHNITDSIYTGGANISCFGLLDGTISIDSVSGGTLPYYYSIIGTPAPIASGFYNVDSTDHLFDSLAAAWYYADVIDANGCTYRDSIILTQPDSLQIDSFTVSTYIGGWGVSCNGFNDGAASAHISGGTFDSVMYHYTYQWTSNTDTLFNDSLVSTTNLYANHWYVLNVTDINGCNTVDSTQLSEPTALLIDSFTVNNVLCVGGDRGNATVWVSGATGGYTYLWNNENTTSPTYVNPNDTVGSHNDTTPLADTLRAGDYIVQVWDTNGCYITDTITITEPSISVEIDSLVVTQITCYNYNNASVDIISTGPEPLPYLYTIYESSNPSTITAQGNLGFNQGLSPGNYVAHVQDGIGCVDRDTFEIHVVDSVYIVGIQWENVSCNGFDDGYVWDIVATGGTWPYEYSINGGITRYPSWLCNNQNPSCPTGYVFTGLDPGVHTIEIYDSNDCANSYSITVTEPSPMQFAISTNNYNNYEIPCAGDLDSAFIVVSGGDPIYTITVDGNLDPNGTSTTSSSYDWGGIDAGWHVFEITDINNCIVKDSIQFSEPDPIDASNSIMTDVLCQDSCTGEITAVISGGVGQGVGSNYQYQWYEGLGLSSPISGENSYVIQNLCIAPDSTYTIHVTDDNGCEGIFDWTIGSNVLKIDSVGTAFGLTDPSCYGYCDGSITIIVNGGSPSQVPGQSTYYYEWDDVLQQNTATAIGLCDGIFTCTVTDMNGCVVTEDFILTQPDLLVAQIDLIESVSCNGSSDGEIRATVNGGTANYDFIWSEGTVTNNQLASTINGLVAGLYSVFVEDENGCTDTAHYDLTEPLVLDIPIANIVINDVLCYDGSSGSISITAINGTVIPGIPGSYEYILLDESGSSISNTVTAPTATFSGLSMGIYSVKVTDYNGCTYTTGDIYIDQPDEPLSILIDAADGSCNSSASVTVHISGGTSGYDYTWSNSTGGTNGIIDPVGTGETGATNVEVPGEGYVDYNVLVTDANGCTINGSASVRGYDNIFLPNYSNTYSATVCQGGLIQIPVAECDGCTYFWMRSQDTIANTASLDIYSDISWLPIETLTLIITDAFGCVYSIDATITKDDVNAAATVSPDNNVAPGSTITLSASGSFNQYTWTVEGGDTISEAREFMFDNIQESSWFWVYVENANNCKDYDSIYVVVGSQPVNAFSPNGDGFNEYWYVKDIDQFNGNIVQIYNRWGELIFEDNCSQECWDGKIDGKDAPVGAYYYIIDHNDGSELLKGSITLVR